MNGERRRILFLLLVTLSSVMGLDFTFSKEAYDAILNTQLTYGYSFKDAAPFKFLNMDHDEPLLVPSHDELLITEVPKGIHMAPLDHKAVKAAITRDKNQEPQRLYYASIVFSKISHETGETIFGNFMMCFQHSHESPDDSCMTTFMFAPPKSSEDKKYAKKIAEELNPLSKTQVQNISEKKPLKWALSSLEKVLSSGMKEYVHAVRKEQPTFALKPIIVNQDLMKEYFDLAHPRGSVQEVGLFTGSHPTWAGSDNSFLGFDLE